jgi:putative endonuclease
MANERNGTLYIGVTSSLVKRVHEHKSKLVEGFSKRYGLDKLVYFEPIKSQEEAFLREKRLKTWKRNWKLELIEKGNPEWKDLYSDLI